MNDEYLKHKFTSSFAIGTSHKIWNKKGIKTILLFKLDG